MPPCSPASNCAPRNPRHARFAKAKLARGLRVAPGRSLTRLRAAAFSKGSGLGASAPRSAREVRLVPRRRRTRGGRRLGLAELAEECRIDEMELLADRKSTR